MKILDRYILRELAAPFLFGVAAFSIVFVAGNLLFKFARLVSEQGMPLGDALLVFIYWLPRYLVLTFPMAALLAALLAFGRLSGDGETTALRAGGISFARVMLPVIAAGLAVSGFTLAFDETVVPTSSRAAERLLIRAGAQPRAQQHLLAPTFDQGRIASLVYAAEFDRAPGVLRDVTFIQYRRGRAVAVVEAARARWEGAGEWRFYDGFAQALDPYRQTTAIFSGERPAIFDLGHDPTSIALLRRAPEEMTWRELGRHLARLQQEGRPAPALRVQWHHKLSVPFASLIFVLVGAPLGLRSPRTGSALGLGLSVIIIFAYYVVWNYLTILAGRGAFPPLWAAWTPNLIGLVIGTVLIRRVMT